MAPISAGWGRHENRLFAGGQNVHRALAEATGPAEVPDRGPPPLALPDLGDVADNLDRSNGHDSPSRYRKRMRGSIQA